MTLIIKDLEVSEELDREAMRAIVGLGLRRRWLSQSHPFYLIDAASHDSAALRWSAFLRPLQVQSPRPQLAKKRPATWRPS